MDKRKGRTIQIFEIPGMRRVDLHPSRLPRPIMAYVSIGPGETRVTIVDGEGRDIMGWTAVFGWADLSACLPRDETPDQATIDQGSQAAILAKPSHAAAVAITLGDSIDEIIARTFNGRHDISTVVVAAPDWLHGLIRDGIMPRRRDIHPEIAPLT